MKKILLLIITIIPLLLIAQTPVPPGPVSGTWNLAGSPYMVNGEIYIDETATLYIEPGVVIRFTGWYKFIVNGSLMAEGTESGYIHFTAQDTNVRWHGIRFKETTGTSVLDYCIVEYGLTVLNQSTIPDNSGGGILCYSSPNASITIRNSNIQHNQAWFGGGIDTYNADNFVAERNLIAYNTAKYGGGYSTYDASGSFENNTIAYNEGTMQGGGIWVHQNCAPSFTSDIIYFNLANGLPNQVCLSTSSGIPDFYYCDIQDDTAGFSGIGTHGDYENCIDGDPLFEDAPNGDFSLSWASYPQPGFSMSPCIDAGCPGFPGPDSTCKDIGAYQFFQQLDVPEVLEAIDITQISFLAQWTSAFGALGYYLDVAMDFTFVNMVYENIQIIGDTVFFVEGLDCQTAYYYRVRSYNTALTSPNSNNILVVTNDCVSVNENNIDELEIFSSQNRIYIKINENLSSPGSILVYNTAGQLLIQQQIHSGSNTIDPKVTDQIIFAKVILEGKVYQQKLLVK